MPTSTHQLHLAEHRFETIALHLLFSAVKQQPLMNVRQGQCLSSRERLALLLSAPAQARLEPLLHLNRKRDGHTLSPPAPRLDAVLESQGQAEAVSPGLLRSFCYSAGCSPQRSLTLCPCDTVMGWDMVFVGLLLIFSHL